jgi:hypothetical protein
MISVLVYGRNDTYGYNLHKRAAISLNTIAALLEDDDDEILFVDYNTPDDFPTFPEAIRDTLTEQARQRIRVLRVRPELHRRKSDADSLPVIEPLARNIGLRRMNPANRWVLSTNTDIILGLRSAESFKALLSRLECGFYQAPRVEIPETVWEGFDRSNPEAILSDMRWLAPALHLDEIVYGNTEVLFDGCGDFQLAEREVLFALDGFHERMDRGWHVDSNLSVRMTQYFGAITSLEDQLFAYHCDHTRQVTPLHKPESAQNDSAVFVDAVTAADIPEQRSTWGAAGEEIEELRLNDSQSQQYLTALQRAIGAPQKAAITSAYRNDSYDSFDYDPRHVMPFLADLVASAPRSIRLGWAGFRDETLAAFLTVWQELGFTQPVSVLTKATDSEVDQWIDRCDIYVLDFGAPSPGKPVNRSQRGLLGHALYQIRARENRRIAEGLAPKRVVGIDVVHNRFERAFKTAVAAASTPYSTRIRAGYARPMGEQDFHETMIGGDRDWLEHCHVGKAGYRNGKGVESVRGAAGHVIYGPYWPLPPGHYSAQMDICGGKTDLAKALTSKRPMLIMDVRTSDNEQLARKFIMPSTADRQIALPFTVKGWHIAFPLEVRLYTSGASEFTIRRLTVDRV